MTRADVFSLHFAHAHYLDVSIFICFSVNEERFDNENSFFAVSFPPNTK